MGEKSDHRIVLMKPINVINNKSARHTGVIKVRPMPQSGMDKMRDWMMDETWDKVFSAQSSHEKAALFQNMLLTKFEMFFPEKIRKILMMPLG